MSQVKPIRRIAVVGTGVIGASWAAYYLSRGFDVVATDPAPNAESALQPMPHWYEVFSGVHVALGAAREPR